MTQMQSLLTLAKKSSFTYERQTQTLRTTTAVASENIRSQFLNTLPRSKAQCSTAAVYMLHPGGFHTPRLPNSSTGSQSTQAPNVLAAKALQNLRPTVCFPGPVIILTMQEKPSSALELERKRLPAWSPSHFQCDTYGPISARMWIMLPSPCLSV